MTGSIVFDCWLAVAVGFVMDLIFGDPYWLPHPVRFIGWMITKLEKRIRRNAGAVKQLRAGAVKLLIVISFVTAALCFGIIYGLSLLGEIWLFAGMVYFSYTALGTSCLAREAKKVEKALEKDLEEGRKQLSYIVGRDTAKLSEEEIIKATVETVAENTTDGSVSVLFYLFAGGPVLAYFFKAVSTLDSMIGYRNEKYKDIGWASAKLDDILNYIPARISGVLMVLSAYLMGLDGNNAFRILKRDHANHLSPNCAWTEAAAAGALGLSLGGSHEYFGRIVEKKTIGDRKRNTERADIRRMNRLMYTTVCLAFAVLCLISGLVFLITM